MEITLPEAVNLLSVPESTVCRWVRQGHIPCNYRNGEYFFNPVTLKSWAKTKQIHISRKLTTRPEIQKVEEANLIEALEIGGVYYAINEDSKSAIFKEVENRFALPSSPHLSLSEQLLKRENLASTSIGHGIAVPHPQYPTDWGLGEPAIGTFYLDHPVDWNAVGGQQVWLLFVLLSPSSQIHLRLLSQLAQILRNASIIEFLKNQPSINNIAKQFKKSLEKNY